MVAVFVGDHDPAGIHITDDTVFLRNHTRAGVLRHAVFNTSADKRAVRFQKRYGLTLHVRAHQRTGRVIVFQERNAGRGDTDDLFRGNVGEFDVFALDHQGLPFVTADDVFVNQFMILDFVCLRNVILHFIIRRQVDDIIGDPVILIHFAVRSLNESVFVDPCIGRQVVDQTDVRTFRRFDRADSSIVRGVYVTHFEACAFSGQAARTQRGNTALVGKFGQRILLVHELRQLGTREEFLDRTG